jgi:cellulose synthase (UDP-forming)
MTTIDLSSDGLQLLDLPTDPELPSPPTDEEKYAYYGRQHLWFIRLRTVATISAAVSLLLFSSTTVSLWLFWIPLTIFAGYLVLTHYCTTRKATLSRLDHERIVSEWSPTEAPSVDVFLPSAGEELEVLNNTYRHVAALEYPGTVKVWVLDDSARPDVRFLAEAYGFEYRTRPDRGRMKKAGNLKYGFGLSDGDVIAIFDADFCPRTDFLSELVPYFSDDGIAIVQSPQFFDTGSSMHWLKRCAGSVQESFYRWAQVSRNTLGAPICVGTCALYRRSALKKSGGFAQIGHSEDVHTGVNLMKAGYRTLYVPVVLAKGLCPDNLSSFISQQYRWCAGSMSLLADQAFHDAPLTYRQRMCFFTGFGYYISTAVGVYALALPTIIMLWFLPDRVQLSNFFWIFPTLALYPLIAMVHKTSWTPATLRVYTVSSFAHAAAIAHALRGHAAEWVPSGSARKTSMTKTVTTLLIGWSAITNVLMGAGVIKFLVDGRSIVDVFPVAFYCLLSAYVWIPVAVMAWRERQRVTTLRLSTQGGAERVASDDAAAGHAASADEVVELDGALYLWFDSALIGVV